MPLQKKDAAKIECKPTGRIRDLVSKYLASLPWGGENRDSLNKIDRPDS